MKPEIETPESHWGVEELRVASEALTALQAALEKAADLRRWADDTLKTIHRPVLTYTRDYLEDSLGEVVNEIDEIKDALARYEEDVA